MRAGEMTKAVAEQALKTTAVVVADMREAARTGQTSDILAATVEMYRGVAQYLNSQQDRDGSGEKENIPAPNELELDRLKRNLKNDAGDFCDALTSTSAPDARPVGSAFDDFAFTCQKVQQRASAKNGDQALLPLDAMFADMHFD